VSSGEAISAIRAVRLAAHELFNACSTITGGTEMAISTPTVSTIGKPVREVTVKRLENKP